MMNNFPCIIGLKVKKNVALTVKKGAQSNQCKLSVILMLLEQQNIDFLSLRKKQHGSVIYIFANYELNKGKFRPIQFVESIFLHCFHTFAHNSGYSFTMSVEYIFSLALEFFNRAVCAKTKAEGDLSEGTVAQIKNKFACSFN